MTHEPDMLLPPEMAEAAEEAGVRKAHLPTPILFVLAILAGAFIALGAVLSHVVLTGNTAHWGLMRWVAGLAFSLGLVLVIFSGAELFTGNNLLVMAFANKRISLYRLFRNWFWVLLGNALGASLIAVLIYFSGYAGMHQGDVGLTVLQAAASKCALSASSAFFLGVLCNMLVCLAVWMSLSALDAGGKLWTIVFPVAAFIACGFEHVVANLYLFPLAYLLKVFPSEGGLFAVPDTAVLMAIEPVSMMRNLFFVLLGNMVGGVVLVGLVYWFVYLQKRTSKL
jgi:formate/nitrite transporter